MSSSGLKRHMQHHTGQYSHFCEVCRKGFNNTYNFNEHVRAHEGKGYPCEYCGKVFKNVENQKYHVPEHTGVYRFHCDVCQKGYNEKGLFLKHMDTHRN